MKIPVLWWGEKERGSWACTNMLNEIFDLYECEHVKTLPERGGCVIVLHGGNAQLNGEGFACADAINRAAESLDYLILVSVGDEACEFPYARLRHDNARFWLQTPLPNVKADRYLIEGYPNGTKKADADRHLSWFFAGQVTHERRRQCVEALKFMSNGMVITTEGFGQGLPPESYYNIMSHAKIVPCPSGPASPDTFRIWEALECGAVPIVDARSLRDETVGFWDVVLGPDHPLTLIDDWSTLPVVVSGILGDYERYQRLTQYWWKKKKLEMRSWLAQDLILLGAK